MKQNFEISFRITMLMFVCASIHDIQPQFPVTDNFSWFSEKKSYNTKVDACYLKLIFCFFLQNYLNESLKYMDKSYPNTSLAGLHTPVADTKPIYIDTKALLGHHHVDSNKNNTNSK